MDNSNVQADIKPYLLPTQEVKEPVEFAEQQLKVFWLPNEIKVEKDIQDVLVNFAEADRHAVIETLKLFSLYETHAGDEYWGDRFKKMFDGAEFHRMASVFSMFELAVHAPFYNKINELLNKNTKDFYLQYKDEAVLRDRIKSIGDIISDPDDLISLAGFSMVEGTILYSNFAFLKSYQSEGKNQIMNVVRGINFSVRDENIHSLAGAWSFKYKLEKIADEEYKQKIKAKVQNLALLLLEHETLIIKRLFLKGALHITEQELVEFVKSRLNICMNQLGYENLFEITDNPIAEWFYKGINNYQFNDFFTGIGSQYHREWDEDAFEWKSELNTETEKEVN